MDFGDYLKKLTLVVEHYLQQERPATESWRQVDGDQETRATGSARDEERNEAAIYGAAKAPETSFPKAVLQMLLGGRGQPREPPS